MRPTLAAARPFKRPRSAAGHCDGLGAFPELNGKRSVPSKNQDMVPQRALNLAASFAYRRRAILDAELSCKTIA